MNKRSDPQCDTFRVDLFEDIQTNLIKQMKEKYQCVCTNGNGT